MPEDPSQDSPGAPTGPGDVRSRRARVCGRLWRWSSRGPEPVRGVRPPRSRGRAGTPGFRRSCAEPRAGACTRIAMLPPGCWLARMSVCGTGVSSKSKMRDSAGVDVAFDHQPVGLGRLRAGGEVRALDALLAHPDVGCVHRQIEAGGAGAEDDHAAALDDDARHREGLLARVLEHHVDVALAGDVPDRLAELAALPSSRRRTPRDRGCRATGPSRRSPCG